MAQQNESAKTKTVQVLRVFSKAPKGFRRAGFAFGAEAKDLPLASLKAAQIKAIKQEPMLVAIETEIQVAAERE